MLTLSHNQPMPFEMGVEWREVAISGCPNGCKIYQKLQKIDGEFLPQDVYVYAHNSNYGCRR